MDTDDSESEEMSESSYTEEPNSQETVPFEISSDVIMKYLFSFYFIAS